MEKIEIKIDISFGNQRAAFDSVELRPEIDRLKEARSRGYETEYASINLPGDDALRRVVHEVVALKKQHSPSLMIVVGIGGSSLGAQAVYEAVFGGSGASACRLLFAKTVDSDHIFAVMAQMIAELEQNRKVLINVISKSGSTTETVAVFEILLDLLKRYHPHDYHQFVVATTDQGSPLWHFAQKNKFDVLTVPAQVGGRYSVFSVVGLFPLAMAGVDIDALCRGGQDMLERCLSDHDNPAAQTAALAIQWYKLGVNVHDFFVFSYDLVSLGAWYRQLVGESLGKMHNRQGKTVEVGITPTVSIGSDDLHSVGQLYLGGPRDKLVTFVTVDHYNIDLAVPRWPAYDILVPKIQGKKLSALMQAIVQGVQRAYRKAERPFIAITLPDKSAYSIGQLLQYKMIEIMYGGFLLQVNPFDQPQVELYKQETREILAHE